ncbi:MAG: hypothetical protein ACLS7Q_07530 [Varibaculum cambriense]
MSEKSNEPRQPDLFSAAMPAADALDQPDLKEKRASSPSKTVTARPPRKKAAPSPEPVAEKILILMFPRRCALPSWNTPIR